jgi:hypothetical protein
LFSADTAAARNGGLFNAFSDDDLFNDTARCLSQWQLVLCCNNGGSFSATMAACLMLWLVIL